MEKKANNSNHKFQIQNDYDSGWKIYKLDIQS